MVAGRRVDTVAGTRLDTRGNRGTRYEGYGSREETHITIAFNYSGSLWYHLRMESAALHPMQEERIQCSMQCNE